MATPSTAELTDPVPFPDDPGEPVWQERRTVPVFAFYGVPLVFLVAGAVALHQPALRIAAGLLALVMVWRLRAAHRRSLIETYAVSDRFLTIVQPGGGRVALPVETVRRVKVNGPKVRIEATGGVVTWGFVRGQKRFFRALERVASGGRRESGADRERAHQGSGERAADQCDHGEVSIGPGGAAAAARGGGWDEENGRGDWI